MINSVYGEKNIVAYLPSLIATTKIKLIINLKKTQMSLMLSSDEVGSRKKHFKTDTETFPVLQSGLLNGGALIQRTRNPGFDILFRLKFLSRNIVFLT